MILTSSDRLMPLVDRNNEVPEEFPTTVEELLFMKGEQVDSPEDDKTWLTKVQMSA